MNKRRAILIFIPFAWLLIFFAVPLFMAFKISLSHSVTAIPPYAPTFGLSEGWAGFKDALSRLTLDNYRFLISDSLYLKAYLSSVGVALKATILTLLVGYPMAYGMARATPQTRMVLLFLVILPFWTSFLVRIYSWIGILSNEGMLNQLFMFLGLTDGPIKMLNTPFAIYIGIIYAYLPFMVLPLYATLEKMDLSLNEAAMDLGCSRPKAFWLVTVPLSLPGIVAGCFLVFIPAIGEFVIPTLLGGSSKLMIGKVLFEEFFSNRDWPLAAAVAVVLLLLLVVPIVLFQRSQEFEQNKELQR